MHNNLVKATLLAAILALAPAAGFAQAPNTTAKGNDAAATGTSQLPERPGYVGGNTVEHDQVDLEHERAAGPQYPEGGGLHGH